MTNSEPGASADDPRAIVDQLRLEIVELEDDIPLEDKDTDDERWADTHLAGLPLDYTAVATAAADRLIPRRDLNNDARMAAVASVRNALTERRRMIGPLPVVLRAVRERQGITIDELAARSGLEPGELADLERGRAPVHPDRLSAEQVGGWIRSLAVPRETAIAALRRSLSAAVADQPVLAAGLSDQARKNDAFIAKVEAFLNRGDEEDS